MVWNLWLAHLLGDFVFQTDWMVRKRDQLWVLALHAGIHFLLMLILVGPARSAAWPFLLLLAAAHLVQDRIKNNITNKRRDWIQTGFIVDQALHFASIWVLVGWFQYGSGTVVAPEKPAGVIVAIAYLMVTFVWFVSERVFNLSDSEYLQNINNTKFPRMLSRTALVSLLWLFWGWAASGMAVLFSNPYPPSKYRQRAVLTDVSVSLLAILFLFWALR